MKRILSWISGFFALLASALFIGWRHSEKQKAELKQKVRTMETKDRIAREQDATVDKVKRTEADRIEQHTKPDGRSRADRINSVLNDRNNP